MLFNESKVKTTIGFYPLPNFMFSNCASNLNLDFEFSNVFQFPIKKIKIQTKSQE